jgi:DnaJ-class molecular chaperone
MLFNEKIRLCTACDGKGLLDVPKNESETCANCNGEGVRLSIPSSAMKAKCTDCGGYGSIIRVATESQTCALCNGKGQMLR